MNENSTVITDALIWQTSPLYTTLAECDPNENKNITAYLRHSMNGMRTSLDAIPRISAKRGLVIDTINISLEYEPMDCDHPSIRHGGTVRSQIKVAFRKP